MNRKYAIKAGSHADTCHDMCNPLAVKRELTQTVKQIGDYARQKLTNPCSPFNKRTNKQT